MIYNVKSGSLIKQNDFMQKNQVQSNRELTDNHSEEEKDSIEISFDNNKKLTYTKQTHKLNSDEIDKLWAESEQAAEALKNIVENLISKQNQNINDFNSNSGNIKRTISEAQGMISEDGEWGVDAVSTRIVDFAKAISGGDKTKINELREAIKKGFQEAEQYLGTLPDISSKTYDAVMEKLDAWESES